MGAVNFYSSYSNFVELCISYHKVLLLLQESKQLLRNKEYYLESYKSSLFRVATL